MNNTVYMLILVGVMALVTYLIRMIPFVFFKKKIKSRFIKSLLYYVPYAVLSSMTFPSIFYATNNVYTAMVGTAVALVASISKRSLVVVAICSVLAVFLSEVIITFLI